MKRTMAVILAGGEGERLSILSGVRAKPAVPFGGKYRIIDFTLSNCVNSDIDNVVVLTQYNPRSLNDHIGLGRPWDLDRNRAASSCSSRTSPAAASRSGTAARRRRLPELQRPRARGRRHVLVLAGDHIYKMDYQPFITAHRRHRADVTIAVRRVPLAEASRMGSSPSTTTTRSSSGRRSPSSPRATSPRWASTSSRRRRCGAGSATTATTSGGT
jgi:glucose-1-phosphate adenylyltransferase